MLGRALMARLAQEQNVEAIGLCHSRTGAGLVPCDLSDIGSIGPLLDRFQPDAIIHTAAIRDPDEFAADVSLARRLNVESTAAIARWTAAHPGAFMAYLSSDYVFNGTKAPYAVTDPLAPANSYGKSKADGEVVVRDTCANSAAILRVPILWGDVETLAESSVTKVLATVLKRAPAVVDDWAVRYPTHVADVADILTQIVQRRIAGTFHWSSLEPLTKYDMAMIDAELADVDSTLFSRSGAPANGSEPRPKDCHLDRSALEALGVTTPGILYRDQVKKLLARFA